jgi:predicted phosphodiesterase
MSRFAVISDIHGNVHALEAVLGRVERLQVDEILCLGDIVGYGPAPDRCLDLVMRCCTSAVRGNHDEAVINPAREAEFNGLAREAIVWTREALGPLHKDALCRLRAIDVPHPLVTCVHDCPVSGPTDYVHDSHMAALAFAGMSTPICLLGHTHVPLVFEAPSRGAGAPVSPQDVIAHVAPDGVPIALDRDRRHICNPGSVGQPRDADPRASFAVLDLKARTFTVHRTVYDLEAARAAMEEAGLPSVLADRLAIGA